tara:strand:+ start:1160 stop:1837 length:678 start_codon:yes stop_codon:yes gene_type:complete
METTNFIPKEKLSAYQRWELDSFDTPGQTNSSNKQEKPEPNQHNVVQLSPEEQSVEIFQEAKEAGHTAGYQEGFAAGRKDAETEVKAEIARLQTLLSKFDQDLQTIDQQVAQDLLALTLNLTKRMIAQALRIHPELIIPIVQEAIRQLPNSLQQPILVLHPDEATLVRNHLGDQLSQAHWEIHEDEQVTKGGCRLITSTCEVDASIETRWQRVLATIGQEDNWLE